MRFSLSNDVNFIKSGLVFVKIFKFESHCIIGTVLNDVFLKIKLMFILHLVHFYFALMTAFILPCMLFIKFEHSAHSIQFHILEHNSRFFKDPKMPLRGVSYQLMYLLIFVHNIQSDLDVDIERVMLTLEILILQPISHTFGSVLRIVFMLKY